MDNPVDELVYDTSTVAPQSPTKHPNFNSFDLSESGRQLAALKDLVFNTPDINHAHVQVVKEALEAERYQIRSHLIAEKLLEYPLLKRA